MTIASSFLDVDSIKWVAELANVREIALHGSADLDYWAERLQPESLQPIAREGAAQIMILLGQGKFKGFEFRELSFALLVSPVGTSDKSRTAYMIRAFNTNRFFAFCERVFFCTPYEFGIVDASFTLPLSFTLSKKGVPILGARMEDAAIEPLRDSRCSTTAEWLGPVFLPRRSQDRAVAPRLFYSSIRGDVQVYPFDESRHVFEVAPPNPRHTTQALVDSRFRPLEWSHRTAARHAKSKTYRLTPSSR